MEDAELEQWEGGFERWVAGLGTVDSAHDLAHVRRVVKGARQIGRAEGASPEVVIPAAWLHDCAAIPKSSPDRKNASKIAAARALVFLRDSAYPAGTHQAIVHAIEAHSFSAAIKPKTLEAKVVQDADRLDALGAIGIARSFALGGEMGRIMYSEADPFCEGRPADDGKFSLDHFPAKLLGLAEKMQTETGRKEAGRRTAMMRSFLEELRLEIEISETR